MSELDRCIGTRENGPITETSYETPEKVVAEIIINGIARRDYDSTGSVEVELFSDKILVMSSGGMNQSIKPEELTRAHASFPNNSLIAEVLYQARFIEKMGGTTDMIRLCRENNLPEPRSEMGPRYCHVSLLRPRICPQLIKEGDTVEKTVEIIIDAIRNNPKITQQKLMEITGMTRRGVEWNFQ